MKSDIEKIIDQELEELQTLIQQHLPARGRTFPAEASAWLNSFRKGEI